MTLLQRECYLKQTFVLSSRAMQKPKRNNISVDKNVKRAEESVKKMKRTL